MTISHVQVEADGWTLRVTGTWAASTFADFDPGPSSGLFNTPSNTVADRALWDWDTARVRVTTTGTGYDRTGGQAVLNATRTRQTVCHCVRPNRYPDWPTAPQLSSFGPWPGYRPLNRLLGEEDLGGGVRRIRLMLHKPVLPGETVSVQFLAGWRAGLAGQTISATNNSTATLPVPNVRWATAPYQAVRGDPLAPATSFPVDLLVGHVLPEGLTAIAGLRLCATDGTNKVFTWISPGTSAQADALRCWTGNADLTGLNAGPIAIHWSAYPFFGPVRHSSGTDPATTAASTLHPGANTNDAGFGAAAETPLMIGYDPTGARYGYTTTGSTYWRYVCVPVDPAGTAATPGTRAAAEAVIGLGNTEAEARAAALALPLASRVPNSSAALTTLARLQRNLSAANGSPGVTNSAGGMSVFFVDGVHVMNTATVSGSPGAGELWPIIEGSSKTACTVQSALSGTNQLAYSNRANFRNMRIEPGPGSLNCARAWFHNVDLADQAGQTASTQHTTTTLAASLVRFYYTGDTTITMASLSFALVNNAAGLYRNVSFSRQLAGVVNIGCTRTASGGLTPFIVYNLAAGSSNACFEDAAIWNCDVRGATGGSVFGVNLPSYTDGDGRLKMVRHMVVNSVFEHIGATDAPSWQIGENNSTQLDVTGLIFEGLTVVGDRANHHYNEPSPVDQAGTFSRFNSYSFCRTANCYSDRWAGKHDLFFDGTVSTLRASLGADDGNRGRRSHLTQGWQVMFGHLNEGNVDANRVTWGLGGSGGSGPEVHGLRAVLGPNQDPALNASWQWFTDNRSRLGADTGFGNYRPIASAPFLAACRTALIDTDRTGLARNPAGFATGALERVSAPVIAAAQARHLMSGAGPALFGIGPQASATPEFATHGVLSSSAVLESGGVRLDLAPDMALHAARCLAVAIQSRGEARGVRLTSVRNESRTVRPSAD
jgi:hypothetical protein